MLLEDNRKKVIEIALKVQEKELVTLTFGNFSIRDKETDYICITPSGINYEDLKPEDIVVANLHGEVIDGNKKPSTEILMHCAIYKKRQDVFGIIHTHSTMATSWACCGMDIPCISSELSSLIGGPIRCAPYKTQETRELGEVAAATLKDSNAILLKNHGTISVGKDINEAFINSIIVEESAKKAFYAKQIGVLSIISEDECNLIKKNVKKKYGQ
ncbi:class II aldolase/adducin family protein [Clostridium tyrobutyricum]|jgi:L-ribulose-5-phosphate 4-epimerase|uniref:Class II aldolase/adducin N-terminal domain-containing protein n=2 Tax=Clostridium tyrobutyricum TaxID=1519 RepID=W6NAD0_CLOTY|nr:class II aldolase/adducin family protein [Clostridium tyrobutyricum]AND85617.1 class II aldolase and adducin domain-containing protein [Clostridium tyrobutyricum]ANP70141.1 aldolase [Clostridium tyrobutyricum]MBV4419326.1 class II aldolase/adducin family protein [Clostridium tyrobutyricum]MBV4424346.1 class II aldolase/adducin family protein [Clostridium tyrobutyricum]MBV4428748.1 class II aldolase/adducin family protein [Clostridium tyrobutyricum]